MLRHRPLYPCIRCFVRGARHDLDPDEMVSGHVMLGPEVAPVQNVFAGQGNNSLRGPNTQVNDPTFDNIQMLQAAATSETVC